MLLKQKNEKHVRITNKNIMSFLKLYLLDVLIKAILGITETDISTVVVQNADIERMYTLWTKNATTKNASDVKALVRKSRSTFNGKFLYLRCVVNYNTCR